MRNYILLSLILSCFVIITGCGGSNNDNVTVPYDGSITIQPGDTSYTFGGGRRPFVGTQYYTITVKNAKGIPLNDVVVWIDFAWAVPSPVGTIQFFDSDDNPTDAPMNATTDENGVYVLKMKYDGGCGYSYFADLMAHSGSVYAPKVKFTVEGEDCS